MFFDPLSVYATQLCLVLSVMVVVAYVARVPYRGDVRYDTVSEWVGHVPHGIGMAYMSAVMLGMQPLVPFATGVWLFVVCAGVFAVRLLIGAYYIWWWDVTHIAGSLAMSYMFLDPDRWPMLVTCAFICYFGWVIAIYAWYVRQHLALPTRPRIAGLLSDGAHIGMSAAMILMLGIMQWPGTVAGLSGIICHSKAETNTKTAHPGF